MTKHRNAPPIREDGLQLAEHRQFQHAFWTIQRFSWVVFVLICVAAVLGFTGSGGPFHKRDVQFENALVEISRVSRWQTADDISIRFKNSADAHEMTLSQSFLDTFGVEHIQPEPTESRLVSDGQAFRFIADGPPPHAVMLNIRPLHFGWLRFDITIGDDTRSIRTLILP